MRLECLDGTAARRTYVHEWSGRSFGAQNPWLPDTAALRRLHWVDDDPAYPAVEYAKVTERQGVYERLKMAAFLPLDLECALVSRVLQGSAYHAQKRGGRSGCRGTGTARCWTS